MRRALAASLLAGLAAAAPAQAASPLARLAAAAPAQAEPPPASAEAPAAAIVEQPRAFGHVIGDVVTQRVLLQHEGGAFEPAALPKAGRVGPWLERRAPRVERAGDGRRWLVVDYQVINAPQSGLRTIVLPAWQLAPRGAAGAGLAVGRSHLSVAPLTARWAFGEDGLEDVQPDRDAPRIDVAPMRRALVFWSALAAIVLVAWGAWRLWRQWRAARAQPFARAWRELRALDDDAAPAWQSLHRAFDGAAGEVVHPATLQALFERAPHLAAMRADIERFYAESRARFHAAGEAAPGGVSPRALCAALRRLEARHEG